MLSVSAEPEVAEGSCFIWPGFSLRCCLFFMQPYPWRSSRRRKVVPEYDLTWRRAGRGGETKQPGHAS